MSLTHVDPHVSEIVMVWIQSGDLLMVWIQISLNNKMTICSFVELILLAHSIHLSQEPIYEDRIKK
jgi:hypothetical protein